MKTKQSKKRTIPFPQKQKPVLQMLLLCDGLADGPGGKKAIIGLFDSFSDLGPIPSFFIVAGWRRGTGKFTQKFRILDPKLKVIYETSPSDIVLKNPTSGHNVSLQVSGFTFPEPGVYWLEVFLDEERRMSLPFVVKAKPVLAV